MIKFFWFLDLDQDYPTEVAVAWKLDPGLGLYELYIYIYIYLGKL